MKKVLLLCSSDGGEDYPKSREKILNKIGRELDEKYFTITSVQDGVDVQYPQDPIVSHYNGYVLDFFQENPDEVFDMYAWVGCNVLEWLFYTKKDREIFPDKLKLFLNHLKPGGKLLLFERSSGGFVNYDFVQARRGRRGVLIETQETKDFLYIFFDYIRDGVYKKKSFSFGSRRTRSRSKRRQSRYSSPKRRSSRR